MDEITYLIPDPALVRTIAGWHQEAWGHLTGRSIEERIGEFEEQLDSRRVPLTVVARANGDPVGSASLLAEDMDTHPDLTPWLASVFVLPTHRRQGIGERLCRRIVTEAARLGFEKLYLFTEDREDFYRNMGWETLAHENFRGEAVALMELKPGE